MAVNYDDPPQEEKTGVGKVLAQLKSVAPAAPPKPPVQVAGEFNPWEGLSHLSDAQLQAKLLDHRVQEILKNARLSDADKLKAMSDAVKNPSTGW